VRRRDADFEESMTRIQTTSATAMALVLGLSLAAAGCGKYSFGALKAQKAYKEANDLYKAQDWKAAAAKYEYALQSDPNKSEIYFFLGNSYDNMFKVSRLGEPENDANIHKAIANYEKASQLAPDPRIKKLALQYLVAAYGSDKLNDPSKAEPLVQKMITLEPNEPTNYFQLAKIYEDAGKYDEAEQALAKAVQAKPNDPTVHTTASAFYNRQGNFDKTIEALNKAASLDPSNPSGYQLAAAMYWEKASKDHRLGEAQKRAYVMSGLENSDRALKLNPAYVDALVYKGLLLRQEADIEKDRARQQRLVDEASELQKKAIEIRKKKATGAS
jgi:Putative Zn-dependent protease, contains TPR repeats